MLLHWGCAIAECKGLCKRLIEVKEIYFQRQIGREPIEEIRCVSPKQTVPLVTAEGTKPGAYMRAVAGELVADELRFEDRYPVKIPVISVPPPGPKFR